jgi:type IV secretory pathway protease TraF
VSPRARARAAEVAVAAVFAASAAAIFVAGDERNGSTPFFLGWLAVHLLYGIVSGSFWALVIVLTCPPLFVAMFAEDGYDTSLWLESAFVEAFYGVPFAFMGILARRIWQLRRRELPDSSAREESAE